MSETQAKTAAAKALLEGRVALVTGGSRGIGAATAVLLARHGASVGVNYLANRDAADRVVAEIEAAGGRAVAVQGDVGEKDDVDRTVGAVVDAFGPVDTLVLNANAAHDFAFAPFLEMTWEQYEYTITGESRAIFLPVKAVAPSMIEHRRGAIVAVSSATSRNARPGSTAHSAGKSAVDSMVQSMALELGQHGIRVNAVGPGLVETDASARVWKGRPEILERVRTMTPLRRVAQPEDVAGAILMLVSDATGFVTGTYIPVDGGATML